MKNKIKNLLIEALEKNFVKEAVKLVEVQQATAKHIKADYFSNIAMKLSKFVPLLLIYKYFLLPKFFYWIEINYIILNKPAYPSFYHQQLYNQQY